MYLDNTIATAEFRYALYPFPFALFFFPFRTISIVALSNISEIWVFAVFKEQFYPFTKFRNKRIIEVVFDFKLIFRLT